MIIDTNQIYFPAEDTFLLMHAALREVKPEDRVLEVGTGSGAVAKAMMDVAPQTVATEINPHAAQYAGEQGVNVVRGNLLDPLSGEFDLILFNAPYLPTMPEEKLNDWLEFALDGGVTGREVIEKFLPDAVLHLAKFGRILLLISSATGLAEIQELCRKYATICIVADTEKMEDGEMLYVLRISRDLCCFPDGACQSRRA
ncbi:HemK2/MTQ2 family protein methyltransferase [Methanorbis rubei]|uniref:Release factor glutamine methyltransferase n=1 Tax=Methanorbis rubei TaxID=3028300 RepID=A0AAE4MH48_9EURY|nr:Release factor glutamine methyltransferase [Methanocorpusculaceae archaeon Cs1]